MDLNPLKIENNQSLKKSLTVIAKSLNLSLSDYSIRCRSRKYVYLRMIGELYIRQNHPQVRLAEMAHFFGYEDHSTVVNLHASALDKLKNKKEFQEKYNIAMMAIKK